MRKPRLTIGMLAAAFLATTSIGVMPALPAWGVTPGPCPEALTASNRPVAPPGAASDLATFVDPTVTIVGAEHVRVSHRDYVAPYATLVAPSAAEEICIEEGANVQDNTRLEASGGPLHVGEHAIVAHGARIVGAGNAASIAHVDACPLPAPGTDPNTMTTATPRERGLQALANALFEANVTYDCDKVPAFIGFNALNQSDISDGALLGVLSRLPAGVTLHPGYVSFPGKSIDTQAEADTAGGDPTAFDVRYIGAGDILFMQAVLHVNECLARGYTAMYRWDASSVRGINLDPGEFHKCAFNNSTEAPTIGGKTVREPDTVRRYKRDVRIIGEAHVGDIKGISDRTAIRADEGEPFVMGNKITWGVGTTFHALEPGAEDPEVGVTLGDGVVVGAGAVIHGGGRRTREGVGLDPTPTTIQARSTIGAEAVIFRSFLTEGTQVGARAAVIAYDNFLPGDVIPDRCVKFSDTPRGACAYFVEW